MTPSNPYLVSVEGLSQAYDSDKILKGISFQLSVGEVALLMGPNGCGKTTLLKVLCGLVSPLSGKIFEDTSFEGMSLFTPSGGLYNDLTLHENLELFGQLYGHEKILLEELTESLMLTRFLGQRVGSLSHGQKIRGALCRTFLKPASLYLLDEPFTGLDTASSENLSKLILNLKKANKSFLIASHQTERLSVVSDRAYWLEGGALTEK